jgi:hypothetical protein
MSDDEPAAGGEREAWEQFAREARGWCEQRMRDDGEVRIFFMGFEWSPDRGVTANLYATDGGIDGQQAAMFARAAVRKHKLRGVVLCAEAWLSHRSPEQRQAAGYREVKDDPAAGECLLAIASHVAFGEHAYQAVVLRDPLTIKPWLLQPGFDGPMTRLASGWS